jgi:lincosamide nucleotidyltransferase
MQRTNFPSNHQIVIDRFLAVCQADDRIVAAFLGGSYASGTADAHSDLDLYLITTDEAYESFLTERQPFVGRLGEPLFLEDFGKAYYYFMIFADGTEVELGVGHASDFQHIHGGAHTVLLDKQGLLTDATFPLHEADPTEQRENLRQLIMNFWHEVGHFHKALARNQLWFAYGSLETMRHICVNLARLRYNFADEGVGEEPFFKVEAAMPVEQLAPLQATFCPLEIEAIRQAGAILLQFYREVATTLAERHGLVYPAELARVMRVQ